MAEMGVAAAAHDFGAAHTEAIVTVLFYFVGGSGRVEARPSAAGVEFRVGSEQFLPAAHAAIHARSFSIDVLAAERHFRTFLTCDAVLLFCQRLSPFSIRFLDLFHRVSERDYSARCTQTRVPSGRVAPLSSTTPPLTTPAIASCVAAFFAG